MTGNKTLIEKSTATIWLTHEFRDYWVKSTRLYLNKICAFRYAHKNKLQPKQSQGYAE